MPFSIKKIKEDCEKIYNDLRDITCCFTGHRSQKLPWGFNEQDERCLQMRENTKQKNNICYRARIHILYLWNGNWL